MRNYSNQIAHTDLRAMLLKAGVGQFNAVMSIPYMNFLPSTTDPYAQGVIQLVQGLQRLLNQRGAQLVVDGGLGRQTVAALMHYAGPRWYDKSWAQLYADVMLGNSWPGWKRFGRVTKALPMPKASDAYVSATAAMNGYVEGYLEDYLEGVGDVDPHYCSTSNVPPGCTAVAGVIKPMDASTLNIYYNIQRALNALLAKRGEPLIDVDGRLGPQTLSAFYMISSDPSQVDSVETIAQSAAALVGALQIQLVNEGAPFVPDPVPSSPPSTIVGTTVVHPSDEAIAAAAGNGGIAAFLSSPLGLATLAVGGIVLWKMGGKKRRGARR